MTFATVAPILSVVLHWNKYSGKQSEEGTEDMHSLLADSFDLEEKPLHSHSTYLSV